MLKNALIFILGTTFGAYVMRNYMFRKAAMAIIKSNVKNKNEKSETSQTKKES